MATFSYVTLYVDNLPRVRDWYERVIGLQVVWESEAFVMLSGERGGQLGLHAGPSLQDPDSVQLHFEVPDVDVMYEHLHEQGVTFDYPPKDTPWNFRVVGLRDPAGHTVELFHSLSKGAITNPG